MCYTYRLNQKCDSGRISNTRRWLRNLNKHLPNTSLFLFKMNVLIFQNSYEFFRIFKHFLNTRFRNFLNVIPMIFAQSPWIFLRLVWHVGRKTFSKCGALYTFFMSNKYFWNVRKFWKKKFLTIVVLPDCFLQIFIYLLITVLHYCHVKSLLLMSLLRMIYSQIWFWNFDRINLLIVTVRVIHP